MKNAKRIVSMFLALVTLFTCIVMSGCGGCGDNDGPGSGTVIDNETTRLVIATSELDGVFNPFYSSSAPDGSVVGMTQISMLSADKYGKVAFGENEACVVLDYEAIPVLDSKGETEKTIYRFVLKNDLKFSNGSPLTMKDVLFNLYVYLDPAYYGSSTIYSTEIIGLEEYRTQTRNEKEQEEFNKNFDNLASLRISRLVETLTEIYDANKGTTLTEAQLVAELTAQMNDLKEFDPLYATLVDDYYLSKTYFEKDLKTTYNYSRGTAEDISFTDKSGNKVTLTTDTEAFFYNTGYISWDKDNRVFKYSLGEKCKDWTEEQAIAAMTKTISSTLK